MPVGGGKYEALCTRARVAAKATGAALIILNGEKGDGFSVQAPLLVQRNLPAILRFMADQIEADIRDGKL